MRQPGTIELTWSWSDRPAPAAVGRGLLPALARAGVTIALRNATGVPAELPELVSGEGTPRLMLTFGGEGEVPVDETVTSLVEYVVDAPDLVPLARVTEINRRAGLLLVPCNDCREVFLAAGATVPTTVLHPGIAGEVFPAIERQPRFRFTFGATGSRDERDGIDVLLRAFRDEFSRYEAAHLVIRLTDAESWPEELPPHVEVRSGGLEPAARRGELREFDVFVLPARGEVVGLRGLEAMATGLPVIATNWGGPADYLDAADSFPLEFEPREIAGAAGSTCLTDRWAEPSYEQLRQLMRRLYEAPEEARAAGMRAATRVHTEWTWDRAARQLVANLELLERGISLPDSGSPIT